MVHDLHPGSEGAFSRNDPARRSREWRPADTARTARGKFGHRPPGINGLARAVAVHSPSCTAGEAAWVRGWKAPRWSAERSPGRTGKVRALQARASRLARATEVQECACRRSIHPSFGVMRNADTVRRERKKEREEQKSKREGGRARSRERGVPQHEPKERVLAKKPRRGCFPAPPVGLGWPH